MVQETIKKLEAAARAIDSADAKKKTELQSLVIALKEEAAQLTQTHETMARLTRSLKAFEGAHPKTVEIVDEIVLLLGRIGI